MGHTERTLACHKNSERRAQYQVKSLLLSVGIAEPPPILLKDTDNKHFRSIVPSMTHLTDYEGVLG